MTTTNWDDRVDEVWATRAEFSDDELLGRIDALVAERPESDARAAYEAGSARDSIGRETDAAPLYQRALDLGLAEPHLGQLLIQYASTLRNLKRYDEGLALLDLLGDEHPLADAAKAFRALILTSKGDLVGAAVLALQTLAPHLPQYQRAVLAYAEELPERVANGD